MTLPTQGLPLLEAQRLSPSNAEPGGSSPPRPTTPTLAAMYLHESADLGGVVHLELYVVPKTRRAEFRRRARKPIAYARRMTRAVGGSGPHFYRVDQQRAAPGVVRLGRLFNVKPTEDLWLELTFYRDRRGRRAIVRNIWRTEGVAASIEALEALNSKRPGAWAIANASRETV